MLLDMSAKGNGKIVIAEAVNDILYAFAFSENGIVF